MPISDWLVRYIGRGVRYNWQKTLSLCEPRAGSTILDIGCGDGEFTAMVSRKIGATRTIGIDMLPENLVAARARGIIGIRANLDVGLPLLNESADVVVASHVIEHICDTDNFIKECYRVLTWGGMLVIATPNLAAWPNVFFLALGQQPPSTNVSDIAPVGLWSKLWGTGERQIGSVGHLGSNKHRRLFVRSTLKELLEYYGFQCQKLAVSGFPPFSGFVADAVCHLLPLYAWQIVVRGRKPA